MAEEPSLAAQGFVKVRMSGDDGSIETLWGKRTAPDQDHFSLENSPYFAYGISFEDIVEGSIVVDGVYEFVRVIERSGNRTVRLLFDADAEDREAILDAVVALGCTYEGMFGDLFSITVPKSVSLDDVAAYLTSTGLDWEYADPRYEELLG